MKLWLIALQPPYFVAKETRKRDVSCLFRVIREILYRLAFRLPAFVQTPSARADSISSERI